jgi:hypothetical protein
MPGRFHINEIMTFRMSALLLAAIWPNLVQNDGFAIGTISHRERLEKVTAADQVHEIAKIFVDRLHIADLGVRDERNLLCEGEQVDRKKKQRR